MGHSNNNDPKEHVRITEINQIKTKDDLKTQATKLQDFFKTLAGIDKQFGGLRITNTKKKGPNAQKESLVDKNNKHAIQGLYYRQEHRAVQEILFGPTFYCKIKNDKVENYYQSLFTIKPECNISDLPPFLWQNTAPDLKENLSLEKNFSPKQVREKLLMKIHSKLSNSRSVGLDKIKYYHLLKFDPDCSILAAFFNACLRLQMVPEIWKLTYSVLIKENKGDDNNIKNWYSVTMHSTMSKLFQVLIASRLISWSINTNRLSATQKGFLQNNAACETSFILQECKKYAQKTNKDLAVAWLDFSKASDSIPQEAVLHALQRHAVPSSIRNIIESVLQNAQTKIRTLSESGYTKPIDILKGLPQGSPTNPILLDLVIEPVLRNLAAENGDMFQIFNQKLNHFAIPNELTLIAESMTNLQNLLNLVEKTAKSIGLQFNVHKCSTYHYDNKNNRTQQSTFTFYGQHLKILPEEEIDAYFGVKQGLSIGQDGIPTVKEMIDSIETIDASKLNEFQKIESVLTFIMPRVENCLRGLQNISKTPLDEADKVLRDRLKAWLHLPTDSGTESIVFQVYNLKIRTKYLPFLDLLYIMKIVQAFKMFASKDEIVKLIAFESLTAEVSELITKKLVTGVTKDKLASYLSGDLHIKNTESSTIWHMVREATLQLKIKIHLAWQYKNDEMQLVIESNKKKSVLRGNYLSDVEQYLKKALILYYVNDVEKRGPGPMKNLEISSASIKGNKKGTKTHSKSQPLKVAPIQAPIPIMMQLSNFPQLYTVR